MSKEKYRGASAKYGFSAERMYELYKLAYATTRFDELPDNFSLTVSEMDKEVHMKKDVDIAVEVYLDNYKRYLDKDVSVTALYDLAAQKIHDKNVRLEFNQNDGKSFSWQQSSYLNVGFAHIAMQLAFVIPVFEDLGIIYDAKDFKANYDLAVSRHLLYHSTVRSRESYEIDEFNRAIGWRAIDDEHREAFLDAVEKAPGYCNVDRGLFKHRNLLRGIFNFVLITVTVSLVAFFVAIQIFVHNDMAKCYDAGVKLLEAGEVDSALVEFEKIPEYIDYKDIKELLLKYDVPVCKHCGMPLD